MLSKTHHIMRMTLLILNLKQQCVNGLKESKRKGEKEKKSRIRKNKTNYSCQWFICQCLTGETLWIHQNMMLNTWQRKNLLKQRLKQYDDLWLPISSIGNIKLLPYEANRSKKDKTLYDDNTYLDNCSYSLSEIEEKFSYTNKSDLAWLK